MRVLRVSRYPIHYRSDWFTCISTWYMANTVARTGARRQPSQSWVLSLSLLESMSTFLVPGHSVSSTPNFVPREKIARSNNKKAHIDEVHSMSSCRFGTDPEKLVRNHFWIIFLSSHSSTPEERARELLHEVWQVQSQHYQHRTSCRPGMNFRGSDVLFRC